MIEKLGGRKYLLTILVIILAFVLVLVGKVDAESFIKFAAGMGTLYSTANTVTKFVK